MKKVFTLTLLSIIAAPGLAQNAPSLVDQWRGPLPLENERVYQSIFLHLPAQNPDALPHGESRITTQLDIANHLLIPAVDFNGETVTEDFETQRLKVAWRKGLGRDLEVGVRTNITARNGGFMDPLIQGYHHLLSLPGRGDSDILGRDNWPQGRTILSFRNAQGQGIDRGKAFGLGDTTVWLKKQLTKGKFASSASVALKAPTGSERKILGSGGFDAGFAFDARYHFARRWSIYGNLGAAKYSDNFIPGSKSGGVQAGLGFEWRVGRRESIILQSDLASRTVTTGSRVADRLPAIGSIGYKKQINDRSSFWIALEENGDYQSYAVPLFGNIGPDVAFSFGYEIRR